MWKASPLALAILWLIPGLGNAVEIKNVRAAYGAVGATRDSNKIQPGDFVCLVFTIDGLKVNPKTLQANFRIGWDLKNSSGSILKNDAPKETPQQALLSLGGSSVPGVVVVQVPFKQAPGKYTVTISATDKTANKTATHDYPIEVTAPEFGVVGVLAPAFGIPGQPYEAKFHFVNIGLDSKKKPNVDIAINVLDANGKAVCPAAKRSYPRDLPADADLEKLNFVPEWYPIIPNRTGQFTILVEGHDKVANKKTELRIPLAVLDLGKIGGGAGARKTVD